MSKNPSDSPLGPSHEIVVMAQRLGWHPRARTLELRSGAFRSARSGAGMEFRDVREYAHGDDVRSIDWNVTARSGRLQVKNYVDERDVQMILLVDRSVSTGFSTGRLTESKASTIRDIASLLILVGRRSQMGVGAYFFGDEKEGYFPPSCQPHHVARLWEPLLSKLGVPKDSDAKSAFAFLGRLRPRRSQVILISDCLDENLGTVIQACASRHEVVVIQVRDPWENHPQGVGLTMLRDLTRGTRMRLDFRKNTTSKKLEEERRSKDEAMISACQEYGIAVLEIAAGDDGLPSFLRQSFGVWSSGFGSAHA